MIIELKDTNSSAVEAAVVKERRNLGIASGLVYTLVVLCETSQLQKAYESVLTAAREHPSRVLLVVEGKAHSSRLDAEIRSGEEIPGDIITLRLSGELVQHADSVVLPLLLPDLPVIAWWPFGSPEDPGDDLIGKLADRRITDAAGDKDPLRALAIRAKNHTAGDTDLTWTRLTPWRGLLASALDQTHAKVTGVTVEGARDNAPAELLAAWMQYRLRCDVAQKPTRGPGITGVRMETKDGEIALLRMDGRQAKYHVPGQPERQVALRRRSIDELLAEELRRIDPDDIFDKTCAQLLKRDAATKALKDK